MISCQKGFIDIVKELINKGVDVNTKTYEERGNDKKVQH